MICSSTRTNSNDASMPLSTLAAKAIVLRCRRSASTPNSGPKNMIGRNSESAMIPSHVSDSVSSQASQPMATRWIHRPCSEKVLPTR